MNSKFSVDKWGIVEIFFQKKSKSKKASGSGALWCRFFEIEREKSEANFLRIRKETSVNEISWPLIIFLNRALIVGQFCARSARKKVDMSLLEDHYFKKTVGSDLFVPCF